MDHRGTGLQGKNEKKQHAFGEGKGLRNCLHIKLMKLIIGRCI